VRRMANCKVWSAVAPGFPEHKDAQPPKTKRAESRVARDSALFHSSNRSLPSFPDRPLGVSEVRSVYAVVSGNADSSALGPVLAVLAVPSLVTPWSVAVSALRSFRVHSP
jgi:hypothetical protein